MLSELERMGLVERVPNQGATVVLLEPDVVRQIDTDREALERLAAEQIRLPAGRLPLAALRAFQDAHAGAVAAHDPRGASARTWPFMTDCSPSAATPTSRT